MVQDVVVMEVPNFITSEMLQDPEVLAVVLDKLAAIAWNSVWDQWPGRKPLRLEDTRIEWMITDDPNAVEQFQPAHDCEECREGNTRARAFLDTHPGYRVALGNITYVPVWAGLV